MLAYAAHRPVAGKRPSSPPAMLLIISAHVALIALVMSAKMEFTPLKHGRTIIDFIPAPPPPPPPNGSTKSRQQAANVSGSTLVRRSPAVSACLHHAAGFGWGSRSTTTVAPTSRATSAMT